MIRRLSVIAKPNQRTDARRPRPPSVRVRGEADWRCYGAAESQTLQVHTTAAVRAMTSSTAPLVQYSRCECTRSVCSVFCVSRSYSAAKERWSIG